MECAYFSQWSSLGLPILPSHGVGLELCEPALPASGERYADAIKIPGFTAEDIIETMSTFDRQPGDLE
jgi:hypothetical protein